MYHHTTKHCIKTDHRVRSQTRRDEREREIEWERKEKQNASQCIFRSTHFFLTIINISCKCSFTIHIRVDHSFTPITLTNSNSNTVLYITYSYVITSFRYTLLRHGIVQHSYYASGEAGILLLHSKKFYSCIKWSIKWKTSFFSVRNPQVIISHSVSPILSPILSFPPSVHRWNRKLRTFHVSSLYKQLNNRPPILSIQDTNTQSLFQ